MYIIKILYVYIYNFSNFHYLIIYIICKGAQWYIDGSLLANFSMYVIILCIYITIPCGCTYANTY